MNKMKDQGLFVETAIFSGNFYGTSKKAIDDASSDGCTCLLDIDMQGVKSMKQLKIPATFLFIRPPSIEEVRTNSFIMK